MSAIIQVWTAPSCQSGAECLGSLSPWQSCTGSESDDTASSLRLQVPLEVATSAGLADGRILRVRSVARGEQWWFVNQIADGDGDAGSVSATAGNIRQLLSVRGLVRTGTTASQTYRFVTGKQTITSLLNTYVLTNLTEDGLTWLSLGTVDLTDPIEIGTIDRVSRGSVLDLIERQTGHRVVLRATYASGLLSGFAIDVLSDPASGLETVPLSSGAQVETIQRTRDALRAATIAMPFDATGRPMDQCIWRIDSITGAGPYWVTLRDPVATNPNPIREDDQLNGFKVMQRDGTQFTISDSRSSDSAVQLASVGTLAANELVTVVTGDGVRGPHEVTSPSGLASSRGRLVATVGTQQGDSRRNYARNSPPATWTSRTAATGWATKNAAAGVDFQRYERNTPATWSATISETINNGTTYTDLDFTGATPNATIFKGERIRIVSGANIWYFSADATVTADGTGAGNVVFTPGQNFGMNIAANTATVEKTPNGVSFLDYTQRPDNFPDDGGQQTDVMRMGFGWAANGSGIIASSPRIENTAVRVIYDSTRSYLHARAGFTVKEFGNVALPRGTGSTVNTPAVAIIEDTGGNGTVLASGYHNGTIAALATAHVEVSCNVQLAASKTIILGLYPAWGQTPNTTNPAAMTYLRWASLWLAETATDEMGIQANSGSNLLWHRAQDVLANAAAGTRYVIRGVDLDHLQRETGTLSLGQRVRLRSDRLGLDATVKVLKLDYVYSQTEELQLELGSVAPRLTGVTVSL